MPEKVCEMSKKDDLDLVEQIRAMQLANTYNKHKAISVGAFIEYSDAKELTNKWKNINKKNRQKLEKKIEKKFIKYNKKYNINEFSFLMDLIKITNRTENFKDVAKKMDIDYFVLSEIVLLIQVLICQIVEEYSDF